MTDKTFWVLLASCLAALGLVIVLVGVIDQPPSAPTQDAGFLEYQNGVYFTHSVRDFGAALSAFIVRHPGLRVVSIAPLDASGYGRTCGYWILTEPKAK